MESTGPALTVAEIDHVVFRCRDIEKVLDFYTRVLGLKEERRLPQIGLIQLRAGAGLIDLVSATHPRSEDGANVDHVCLGIEAQEMRAVADYLRAAGVEMVGKPVERYGAHGMGLSLYVHDPEGNLIELKQLPPRM